MATWLKRQQPRSVPWLSAPALASSIPTNISTRRPAKRPRCQRSCPGNQNASTARKFPGFPALFPTKRMRIHQHRSAARPAPSRLGPKLGSRAVHRAWVAWIFRAGNPSDPGWVTEAGISTPPPSPVTGGQYTGLAGILIVQAEISGWAQPCAVHGPSDITRCGQLSQTPRRRGGRGVYAHREPTPVTSPPP